MFLRLMKTQKNKGKIMTWKEQCKHCKEKKKKTFVTKQHTGKLLNAAFMLPYSVLSWGVVGSILYLGNIPNILRNVGHCGVIKYPAFHSGCSKSCRLLGETKPCPQH